MPEQRAQRGNTLFRGTRLHARHMDTHTRTRGHGDASIQQRKKRSNHSKRHKQRPKPTTSPTKEGPQPRQPTKARHLDSSHPDNHRPLHLLRIQTMPSNPNMDIEPQPSACCKRAPYTHIQEKSQAWTSHAHTQHQDNTRET